MRKKVISFGILFLGVILAVAWFFYGTVPGVEGGLSARDVLAIRRIVRLEIAEPILRIQGYGGGAATVQTGRTGNGLDGSGHYYRLSLSSKGWEIVTRETWMSALPNQSVERMAAGGRRSRTRAPWTAAIAHFGR